MRCGSIKFHREKTRVLIGEKSFKKVVDKHTTLWYDNRVAAENKKQQRKNIEPWQINSNATLKIPKEELNQNNSSGDFREQKLRTASQAIDELPKNSNAR